MTKLSLRRLWVLYKQVAMAHCSHTRREMMLLQEAFYSGARGVLKVLDHMLEHGDDEGARQTIHRAGRQIKSLTRRKSH